jgi:hypothetical protein
VIYNEIRDRVAQLAEFKRWEQEAEILAFKTPNRAAYMAQMMERRERDAAVLAIIPGTSTLTSQIVARANRKVQRELSTTDYYGNARTHERAHPKAPFAWERPDRKPTVHSPEVPTHPIALTPAYERHKLAGGHRFGPLGLKGGFPGLSHERALPELTKAEAKKLGVMKSPKWARRKANGVHYNPFPKPVPEPSAQTPTDATDKPGTPAGGIGRVGPLPYLGNDVRVGNGPLRTMERKWPIDNNRLPRLSRGRAVRNSLSIVTPIKIGGAFGPASTFNLPTQTDTTTGLPSPIYYLTEEMGAYLVAQQAVNPAHAKGWDVHPRAATGTRPYAHVVPHTPVKLAPKPRNVRVISRDDPAAAERCRNDKAHYPDYLPYPTDKNGKPKIKKADLPITDAQREEVVRNHGILAEAEKNRTRVYGFLLSKGVKPDTAKEVTGRAIETFTLQVSLGKYEEQGRLASYLVKIAKHELSDEARHVTQRGKISIQEYSPLMDELGAGARPEEPGVKRVEPPDEMLVADNPWSNGPRPTPEWTILDMKTNPADVCAEDFYLSPGEYKRKWASIYDWERYLADISRYMTQENFDRTVDILTDIERYKTERKLTQRRRNAGEDVKVKSENEHEAGLIALKRKAKRENEARFIALKRKAS